MGIIADKFGQFDNPPVVFTLFMLRFSKQSSLEKRIPSIQEAFKPDYPIFDSRQKQGLEIVNRPDGGQILNATTLKEYLFFDENRSKGVLLKEDRVVFFTAVYPGFEDFSKWFTQATEIIVSKLNISHYEGLGIRYVDAIYPDYEKGESLSDYLNDFLLPFELPNMEGLESNQVNIYKSAHGRLVQKVFWIPNEDSCIPPDLRDLSSLLKLQVNNKPSHPFVVLDFDHNYSAPDGTAVKLDMTELVSTVDKMHDATSEAFLESIEQSAIGKWNDAS
jgi:uncharacterized protein (TIGR04255 family)